MKLVTFAAVFFVLCVGVVPTRAGFSYSDSFETATFNPFWSTSIRAGSIGMTTSRAHSGSQSAEFSSIENGQDKGLALLHSFDTPMYGTLSVWLFDTGAGASSSNWLNFGITNTQQDNWSASIGTFDYGFQGGGPGRGDQYDFVDAPPIADTFASGITRTAAWHLFTITDLPTGLSLAIDGNVLYTRGTGTPFNTVSLSMGGPSWRPAWTAQFDDFAMTASAVPEPSSLILAALGVSSALPVLVRRKRRRSMPFDAEGSRDRMPH